MTDSRVASPSRTARWLGPAPNLKELNLICWGLFCAFLVLPLTAVAVIHSLRGEPLWQDPEADFVHLYGMGRILNERPAADLYNLDVQRLVADQVHPLKGRTYGPVGYPPFVAVFFRPFALLSYSTAYLLWTAISLVFYLTGLAVLTKSLFPDEPLRRSLIFCFALCFYPLLWTLMTGQLSTAGFLAMAVAMREQQRGRLFLSGAVLSVCLYKPTLLILFLPMLVITRSLRTLFGFLTGALALAAFATATAGVQAWLGYAQMLSWFGRESAAVGSHPFREPSKFVDVASFVSAIQTFRPAVVLVLACAACAGFALVRSWWKPAAGRARLLLWAATLTWTLVLNLYVPIYDATLIVASLIVTAAVLRPFAGTSFYGWFTALWLLILACSWITVDVSQAARFQIVTVLFALLGLLQLAALRRMKPETAEARA